MKQIVVICGTLVLLGALYVSLAAAMSPTGQKQLTRKNPAVKTNQPVNMGNAFLNHLKTGSYSDAYALLSPNLQQEFGDAGGLATMLELPGAKPAQWSLSLPSHDNDNGLMEGSIVYADARRGSVWLTLIQDGKKWQVSSFQFR